ncbi:MAG TPA: L,D-transpeptidase family protein [Candidatus Cloacimonadota bacterium]|nr:L,D-transpeptidase family protein [Candidatus Cloacimonadota bacterium]
MKYLLKYIPVLLIFMSFFSVLYATTESVPYEMINFFLDENADYDDHVLIVDKSLQTVWLYQVTKTPFQLSLLSQYPVTTGKNRGDKEKKGDLKTPEGFYLIEGEIPKTRLTPMYGSGAFPINYPNSIDQYLKKKGNGIWLHGTDKALTPYDTEGCVRFDNHELEALSKYFNFTKTPVIICDVIHWVSVEQLQKESLMLKNMIVEWKEAWESQDLASYLQFYHTDFYTENLKMNFERWARYKERINGKRSHIQIELKHPKFFYSKDYLLVEFNQAYNSSTYSDVGKKSMLWKKEEDNWLILREEWNGYAIPVKSELKIDFENQLPEALDELLKN